MRLSHVEFDIAWERLGLGERPYPITVPSFGETFEERARLREAVAGEPALDELLTLLVRNRFSIDGQVVAGVRLRVLAAGRGERGALAVQTDQEVRLEPVRDPAGAVVALLPEEKPGPGEPVSLPRSLFGEAAQAYANDGYLGFETALRKGGVTGRDLRGLSTLVETGRHGGGQLAANSTDSLGRRTRSTVLNWFDTDAGRYLMYTERRRDGVEWLTLAPGDSGRVARRLTELVASV